MKYFFAWCQLIRLHKPIGIFLLLWPTLLGLFLGKITADQPMAWPPFIDILVFTLGTVLMRSAGCAINDYCDRDIDVHVSRTKQRPLVSGLLQPRVALWTAGILTFMSASLLFFLPSKVWLAALVAAFLAMSYPLTKRFLVMPQAYLGLAFSMGMWMAYTLYQSADARLYTLIFANICAVIAYDTVYAMVDKPDDIKLNIHTSAIFFGRYDAYAVYILYALHLGTHAYLAQHTPSRTFGAFCVFWCMAVALSIKHMYVLHRQNRAKYLQVFAQNHWISLLLLLGWMFA